MHRSAIQQLHLMLSSCSMLVLWRSPNSHEIHCRAIIFLLFLLSKVSQWLSWGERQKPKSFLRSVLFAVWKLQHSVLSMHKSLDHLYHLLEWDFLFTRYPKADFSVICSAQQVSKLPAFSCCSVNQCLLGCGQVCLNGYFCCLIYRSLTCTYVSVSDFSARVSHENAVIATQLW